MDLAGLLVFATAPSHRRRVAGARDRGDRRAGARARAAGRGGVFGRARGWRCRLADLRHRRPDGAGARLRRGLCRHQVCRRGLPPLSCLQAVDGAGRRPRRRGPRARRAPLEAVPRRSRADHGQPQGHGVLPRPAADPPRPDPGDGARLCRARGRDLPRPRPRPLPPISALPARARRLFRSSEAIRAINRGTGAAMAGAAVAIASR